MTQVGCSNAELRLWCMFEVFGCLKAKFVKHSCVTGLILLKKTTHSVVKLWGCLQAKTLQYKKINREKWTLEMTMEKEKYWHVMIQNSRKSRVRRLQLCKIEG